MQLETNNNTKGSQETPQYSKQKRLHRRAKLAVRDPVIATQELLKWHKKHTARGPLIGELANQQEKYAMQDPGTASQELTKWQETYTTRVSQTWKRERRNKSDKQYLILVIKNSQTSTW
jgi:hypothetical protein